MTPESYARIADELYNAFKTTGKFNEAIAIQLTESVLCSLVARYGCESAKAGAR